MSGPWKIPATWQWSTMGEVAEVVGGGTPRTSRAEYYGGDIPWITPADLSGYSEKRISRGARSITRVGLENSSARLMPAETVLFSSRAPIGYVAIAANPVCTNQGFKSFVLRDGLMPDYVYYHLQHAKSLAVELASGTTFLEISGKKAAKIPIPVAPVDEQCRIVAEIEKQFTRFEVGVVALRRVQANLKRYRAAVLKAACEGHFFTTERNQWEDLTLKELLLHSDSVFIDGDWVESKDQDPNGEVRLIQLADIGDGVFRDRSNRFLTKAKALELGCTFLAPGDVLVARMPDPLGRACIFPGSKRECVTVVDVCVVRSTASNFDARWLMHTINAPEVRAQIASLQAGSTRKRISRKNLATIRLGVPSLIEQKRIVAEVERRLSVVEEMETVVSANLQRATRLRQAVLQKAFSGQLCAHV